MKRRNIRIPDDLYDWATKRDSRYGSLTRTIIESLRELRAKDEVLSPQERKKVTWLNSLIEEHG